MSTICHFDFTHSRRFFALLAVLLGLAWSGFAAAQEVVEFTEPAGRFSLQVPGNWAIEASEQAVNLSDPEGLIRVHALALAQADLEKVVAEAWQLVEPELALQPSAVEESPVSLGVERAIQLEYPSEDHVYFATAQLREGTAYVLLFSADPSAVARREAQLQIIQSGFRIAGLENVDLAGVPPRELTPEMITEFEAFVDQVMTHTGLPGAAIAIVQDGQVVHSAGYGVTERGGQQPVTTSTRFMIGSIGKSLTTLLMAKLVDDGLLSWDTPAVEILPEFAVADPQLTQTITARNLVCACSGVPRRDFELIFNADELTAEDLIQSVREFEFLTPFGEVFQYSNQLVATGGYAAAAADGAAWGELQEGYARSLQTRVLDPLGLNRTTLSFSEVVADRNYARPHVLALDGEWHVVATMAEEVVEPAQPAGGHWSTVEDMAKYLLLQLGRGTTPEGLSIVSAENLEVTWQPQVPVTATQSYGLGWFIDNYKGQRLIQHNGSTFGFFSDLAFLPDTGVGIVVLTNGRAPTFFIGQIRTRLFEILFEQPSEAEAQVQYLWQQSLQANQDLAAKVATDENASAARAFEGEYQSEVLGGAMVNLADDRLVIDFGEFEMPMSPVTEQPNAFLSNSVPRPGFVAAFEEMNGRRVMTLITAAGAYPFEYSGQ